MSSGMPIRFRGTPCTIASMRGLLPSTSVRRLSPVYTIAGGIVLTVMPSSANSRATALVSDVTPPFDAE